MKTYAWEKHVRRTEVDPTGHAQLKFVYNWFEESMVNATRAAGWTHERMREAGFFTLQTRHDTIFLGLPQVGDHIQVKSRVIEVLRLRGTWLHELYLMPQEWLLARDFSTGVFLNLDGRPATPPPEMMKDIRLG